MQQQRRFIHADVAGDMEMFYDIIFTLFFFAFIWYWSFESKYWSFFVGEVDVLEVFTVEGMRSAT